MRFTLASLLLATSLGGCASNGLEVDGSDVPVIPVEKLVAKLKCGLSRALEADSHGYAGLHHAVAKVHLAVNIVSGHSVDGSMETTAGIPVFGSSATILPSFSFSSSQTRTINSFIDFDVLLERGDARECGPPSGDGDAGFELWLAQIVAGFNATSHAYPKAVLNSYDYESDFTVKSGGKGGLEVVVSPVKASTSASASRQDVQHMKITIDAVHLDRKSGKVSGGAVPTFVKPIPNGKTAPARSHGNFFLQ